MKPKTNKTNGFALISTLLMMILLMVIAVSMLSFSTVSIKGNSQLLAGQEAKANARMALMMAIGELQKQMGPDQRISANADILDKPGSFDVKHKHWMGAWDSWVAGSIPTDVNTHYPSAASHHQTLGSQADNTMRPEYTRKKDHFRSWLVSMDPKSAADISEAAGSFTASIFPTAAENGITLVGPGSVGSGATTDHVSVPLLSQVNKDGTVSGRYGYWVGDESQKARLMPDAHQGPALTSADKIYRRQAPGSTGTKVARGLGSISNESELSRLPSMSSLELLTDAAGDTGQLNFHTSTVHSNSILADVREGGLKRDLSTILERTISTTDVGSDFMLYEFDDPRFPGNRANSRVPIQDLAAYYQLYDHDPTWSRNRRGGVTSLSTALPSAIQVNTPNYDGGNKDRLKFQGEYTGLYKQPVIAKVQFLLAIGAKEVTNTERVFVQNRAEYYKEPGGYLKFKPMRATDTHKLLLGIMPVVTLWNPNSVPMVMDQSQILRLSHPPIAMRWKKYRSDGTEKTFHYFCLNYALGGGSDNMGRGEWNRPHTFAYRFAKNNPITFAPGEVKMFSAPSISGNLTEEVNFRDVLIDPVNRWDPNGIFLAENSTSPGGYVSSGTESPDAFDLNLNAATNPYEWRSAMVFERNDRITLEVISEKVDGFGAPHRDGRRNSYVSEISGAGFNLSMTDEGFYNGRDKLDMFRNFQMLSRHGGEIGIHGNTITNIEREIVPFNQQLLNPGFPGGAGIINFKDKANAIPCGNLIDSSIAGDAIGIIDFSLSYGCEVSTASQGGFSSGRRIVSRPFLHSGVNAAPLIDQVDPASLYNYGWDWQINQMNNIEDSVVQGEASTGRGYTGGGYTIEAGSTHIVQREIPVVPPISIASLSHAHLGGFSLARNNTLGQNPATDVFENPIWEGVVTAKHNRNRSPIGVDYQQITATGQGGLAPHVVQSIGNSYAHPNLPANKAFAFKPRQLDAQEPSVNAPFVDHSYLANKALWDEYFFSSITPQPNTLSLYGGTGRTAKEVASSFFLGANTLPNRRLKNSNLSLNSSQLDALFTEYGNYNNGFADKIASHLMVEGGFNINSTSVDAWKVLFSSLKGKTNVYLAGGMTPTESTEANTVVGFGALPSAKPIASGSISGPNTPAEQWQAARELSDDEISKLAIAMVKQVKLRGPFLSVSEFINRRLDGTSANESLALKGALQAALDDPAVPINAQFWTAGRILDKETAGITFPFDAAANGPVAYGSAAYVDQADILRGLAEQISPRGDTFIVRAYGDSIGINGEVLARAWCEAVVQRVPEYLDNADAPHVKQANLVSSVNKTFGRKLNIVSFRWLNENEI